MRSDDTAAVARQHPASADDDLAVRLSYIDKLFASFQRSERTVLRLLRLQTALSRIFIALVTELVSTTESVDFTWINLEFLLWRVLGGGAFAVGLLTAMMAVSRDSADTLSCGLYHCTTPLVDRAGGREWLT